MNAVSTLEPGHVVAGRYRVERQIGAGGVGSVYLVRHVHTDEELALKVLQTHALKDASAVERFRKEARAPARISSEHVTRVTDADTAPDLDNAPFLVMELLRGRDLTQAVEEAKSLAPTMVVELIRQVSRALDKAHGLGIIHRDLKPDNLFLTHREDGSPCVKVLDFGIARIADAAPGDVKTQAGLVFGTPGYMAPEQMTGEMELVGPATDVWALGLVAFYLLVGHDYWQARTLTALYAKVLNDPILPPSQCGSTFGERFDAWFLRCVAREPSQRFQSAGEAATALAGGLGIRVSSTSFSRASTDLVPAGLGAGFERPSSSPQYESSLLGTAATHLSVPPPPDTRTNTRTGVMVVGAAGVASLVLVAVLAVHFFGSHDDASAATTAPSVSQPTASLSLVPLGSPVPAVAPSALAVDSGSRAADAVDAAAPAPSGTARDTVPNQVVVTAGKSYTREQQQRLSALQRLCDQGTVTAAECAAKRNAILRGP